MKLKELFDDESKWTQLALARDKNKNVVIFGSSSADCFCLFGGVMKCYPSKFFNTQTRVISLIRGALNVESTLQITQWNDDPNRKFEEVKKLINDLDI